MTERLDQIESQIGTTHKTVESFSVEPGKVEEFARGIKSQNPIYRDRSAARNVGYETIPAPPTFVWASSFPRYVPDGLDADSIFPAFDVEYDIDSILYGGQRYAYERPLYVGDILTGHTTLDDVFMKEGRGGEMIFVIRRTEFTDEDDALVVTGYKTTILLERNDDSEEQDPNVNVAGMEEYESVTQISLPEERDGTVPELVEVGDTGPELMLKDVDRMDFVKYAGASGDFSRPHFNLPVAARAGHPDVFGQGMFSAGLLSNVVVSWFGLQHLREYETRFTSLVFPGDTLTASGKVTDLYEADGGQLAKLDLTVTNQNDTAVVQGTAEVDLDA